MLEWLLSPAFVLAGLSFSWGDLLGFVTGVVNVWLLVRQNPLNWPVGILNVSIYLVVFWYVGLYADAGLQIVYIVLGFYGWWHWLFGGTEGAPPRVSRTSRTEWIVLGAVGFVATIGLWQLLVRVSDSTVPLPDAVTTVLSLIATYGQTRKRVESWLIWITADLIYIPLYVYKGLWLTGLLYVVFLGLCVAGLRAWWFDLGRRVVPSAV